MMLDEKMIVVHLVKKFYPFYGAFCWFYVMFPTINLILCFW
jgi:hypothetical protein